MNKILEMDPLFINKADSKFVFAAFCLVIRNINKDPSYKVRLPIFLDATCSGIQHLATLLKDLELAYEVNLIPKENEEEKVQDIYASLTDHVNLRINELSKIDKKYEKLENIKLTRDILKPSFMTKTYNVTMFGIINQLKSKLPKIKKQNTTFYIVKDSYCNDIILSHNDLVLIAKIVNSILFEKYESLKLIYDYFISVSKILVKVGIPLTWITPSGIILTQNYLLSKITKTSISVGGKAKTIVLREWTKKVDTRKQTQAIIPNIIHSLDSAHIQKLIEKAISIDFSPVLTIHDCFGSLPNKIELLEFLVKLEFINLYSKEDFLAKFHNRFLTSLKDNQVKIFTRLVNLSLMIY